MEITIKATPKEIADLVKEVQKQKINIKATSDRDRFEQLAVELAVEKLVDKCYSELKERPNASC